MSNPVKSTGQEPRMAWGPLVIMSLALFIIIIDTTLLNVSLKAIIHDLKSNTQQIQWVITVYSLILASFTITGGRLGDIFGRKRMFLIGATLFAVGSLIAAASQNFTQMLIGESIVEGFGAALMMPATASLILLNYQGRARAIAFAVWGAMAGVAAAVGPIVGGYLTTNFTWRYGFLINVVVVAILFAFSKLIHDKAPRRRELTIDWGGVVLSASSLLLIVFGVIEASTYGWWNKKADFVIGSYTVPTGTHSITPWAVAIGLVGLVLFYLWEVKVSKTDKTPLLTLDLFGNRPFIAGVISLFAISASLTGFAFILPVFYQSVLQYDAFHSGLANLPLSLALLITAPLGAVLSKRILPKALVITGLVFTGLSVFWVSRLFDPSATAWTFAPALALFGVGMGLVMSQINNLALSEVPMQEAGEASGITNTGRQLGSAIGSAILGTILLAAIPNYLVQGVDSSSVLPAQAKPVIREQLSKSTSDIEFSAPSSEQNSSTPAFIREEIGAIVNKAISQSDAEAAGFATLFVIGGVIVSFWLPRRPAVHAAPGAAPSGH